ncbi:MAG: GNAT family N-acetyltransferase [Planctomycetes bacterium]|nr:GNAT family N-acetyltransferase [Planctomycetota bacterium]
MDDTGPRFGLGEGEELRLLAEADVAELFALTEANRASLEAWLPWVDENRTAEDTARFIGHSRALFTHGAGMVVGVRVPEGLAGVLSLYGINRKNRRAGLAYWLGARFRRRGLATRGCEALVRYAFLELGLHRLELECALGNDPSRAVAERLGFREEGLRREAARLRERYLDLVLYGLLAEEWQAAHPPQPAKR